MILILVLFKVKKLTDLYSQFSIIFHNIFILSSFELYSVNAFNLFTLLIN